METVKILLLTVLPAVVLGCVAGVALGKYQVKKARRQLCSVLNPKQRISYSASIAIGVACVLLGVFLPAPVSPGMDMAANEVHIDNGGMAAFDDINVFPESDSGIDGEISADVETAGDVDSEEFADTDTAVKESTATTRPAAPPVRMRGGDVAVAIMR